MTHCSECGQEVPEDMDTKPDGEGGLICYPCHLGGLTFGRVPEGTLGIGVRAERDLHKRMADEAGHEWQAIG